MGNRLGADAEHPDEHPTVAIRWRLGSGVTMGVLQIVVMIVLSRVVGPAGIGAATLGLVVALLAANSVEAFTIQPVVQAAEVSREYLAAASWAAVAVGASLSLATFLLAGEVAGLLGDPRTVPVLRVLSPVPLVAALSAPRVAMLRRRLGYRRLFVIDAISFVVGYTAIALPLAFFGLEELAIAYATVAQFVVQRVALQSLGRFPLASPRIDADRLQLGAGYLASNWIFYVANRIDYAIVGRILGTVEVGLYTRAYQLMLLPVDQIAGSVQSIAFRTMSRAEGEIERVSVEYRRAVVLVPAVLAPFAAALVVGGEYLVSAVLGPEWAGASAPLAVLSVAMLSRGAYKVSTTTIRALGRVPLDVSHASLYLAAVGAGAVLGAQAGLTGVAVGIGAAIIAMDVLTAYQVGRVLDVASEKVTRGRALGPLMALAGVTVGYGVNPVLPPPGEGVLVDTWMFLLAALAALMGSLAVLKLGWAGTGDVRWLVETFATGRRLRFVRNAILRFLPDTEART